MASETQFRALSEKGEDLYEDTVNKYHGKLSKLIREIDEEINISEQLKPDDKEESTNEINRINVLLDKYLKLSGEYSGYLVRKNTNDSEKELQAHYIMELPTKQKCEHMIDCLQKNTQREDSKDKSVKATRTRSRVSSHSKTSSTVSSAHILLQQKMKLEAAKTKLEYVATESELLKQKLAIETDMAMLSAKKEVDISNAELQVVLNEVYEDQDDKRPSVSYTDKRDIVDNYVTEQSKFVNYPTGERNCLMSEHVDNDQDQGHEGQSEDREGQFEGQGQPSTQGNFLSRSHSPPDHFIPQSNSSPHQINREYQPQGHSICGTLPTASKYQVPLLRGISSCHEEKSISGSENMRHSGKQPSNVKGHELPSRDNTDSNSSATLDNLTTLLLRKELLVSRLAKYDDNPESFLSWKSTFSSVTRELHVSASEEIDLLIKWLGPESGKFATSMRNANVGNFEVGRKRIWQRLDERYGNPETIESSLKHKLAAFPNVGNKDRTKLYELSDLLSEILSTKENPKYQKLLSYFDTSAGVSPVVCKLPQFMRNKWREKATRYKREKQESFPPFDFFVKFVLEQSTMMNDPGFIFDAETVPKRNNVPRFVSTAKTEVVGHPPNTNKHQCIIHKANHSLNDCRAFREKSLEDRRKLLKEHGICFKCLEAKEHRCRDCSENVQCKSCGSKRHATGMHAVPNASATVFMPQKQHGGESKYLENSDACSPVQTLVNSKCTEICNNTFGGKSCAKIVPLNISHIDRPNYCIKTFAILDEQSNRSLARGELFNTFGIHGQAEEYTMSSCAGQVVMSGRRSKGFIVRSLDRTTEMNLPTVIECEEIPNNLDEIPTKAIAEFHPHLQDIADQLSSTAERSQILLLIGRDMIDAHHVLEQRVGPPSAPYAQRLRLGWVVVGETCLDGAHVSSACAMKTYVTNEGRPSALRPCDNKLHIRDILSENVFARTKEDDKPGLSVNDKKFLTIMEKGCRKEGKKWSAPLPFRVPRQRLPDNKAQALRRAKNMESSLKRDSVKREHFCAFMEELLDNGHAEVASPSPPGEEKWYLPLFGIYHPKKKDQIRCVFDSSAKTDGVSLNDVLLSGPDLVNSLIGVLVRFRKEKIAVTADIKKMFYGFLVNPEDRNYLRFLWHKDNDVNKELVDYRMRVHVFGNSPSPAVATYLLRKVANLSQESYGTDVKEAVERKFYVDDFLSSHATAPEAADLLSRTQKVLCEFGDLRLHKICSNSEAVLARFPTEDLAKGLVNIDLQGNEIPTQRSLGLTWDINDDTFTFLTTQENKPFTRRGVLSVINSIFDPLGFIAPVTVQGKLLLRKFMEKGLDWDDTFQKEDYVEWREWKDSLCALQSLHIPRPYVDISPSQALFREVHVFSDASEKAIAAAAYLRVIDDSGMPHCGFLCGKAKVAPVHGHTIPRLELCAAAMAVQMTDFVLEQLDMNIDSVKYFTDSKVVLGYIQNEKRRFFVYVGNRVDIIRKSSSPEQWNYVPTHLNPADIGTRPITAEELQKSIWLQGPQEFLDKTRTNEEPATFELVRPDVDKEIRSDQSVSVMKSNVSCQKFPTDIGTHRYKRFQKWEQLVRAMTFLSNRASHNKKSRIEARRSTEMFILRSVQQEVYKEEICCLQRGESLLKNSQIISLDPYLDAEGMVRVGRRLNKMENSIDRNPYLLPGSHHVSRLLVQCHHEKVKHMGRHFTEGAIRSAGLWITGVKRLVSSTIYKCVTCRKLRGPTLQQKMADLPEDRLESLPPFTNVGLDVFGPWNIITRKTRGGQASAKRWVIIFCCLVTRAVHFEVIEEMSSSSFINALRRFIAIRGNIKILRSDRGTNFIGATKDLRIDTIYVEDEPVRKFLYNSGTTWIFNPPHSSHMGGAWERLIGITRKILDSMLSHTSIKALTHEVFVTLMAEVSAIMNARPLVAVSTDPTSPFVLSPSTLLTMKTEHSVNSFPMDDFNTKDLYSRQWRQVQVLANTFWSRWRMEYLSTLQGRRKWQNQEVNLKVGDVVLMKDNSTHRNEWPIGVVENPIPSSDGLVRKAVIRVSRDGKILNFTRPIVELVKLVES